MTWRTHSKWWPGRRASSPRWRVGLSAACAVTAGLARAQETRRSAPVSHPELRAELRALVEEDQDARFAWIKDQSSDKAESAVEAVDRRTRARMKAIVRRYGWPGQALVGSDGAHDAWLLVQHADRDRPFQRKCLALLKAAVGRRDASGIDLAYLTDRALVGDGKKQIYGTQMIRNAHGVFVTQPTEDVANLDRRRAGVGLPPMAEYKKMMEELYKPQKPGPAVSPGDRH